MSDGAVSSFEVQPVIRVLATGAHTNTAGDVFGGWLMSQVDIAGSVVAHKRAQGRVVTRAVSSFEFLKPVYVGDLVSCYASVEKVGRTSITVAVDVYAERDRGRYEHTKVAQATLTYVAIDEARQPRVVPP